MVMGAFIQKGSLRLHPRMKKFEVNSKSWMNWTNEEKFARYSEFCKGM